MLHHAPLQQVISLATSSALMAIMYVIIPAVFRQYSAVNKHVDSLPTTDTRSCRNSKAIPHSLAMITSSQATTTLSMALSSATCRTRAKGISIGTTSPSTAPSAMPSRKPRTGTSTTAPRPYYCMALPPFSTNYSRPSGQPVRPTLPPSRPSSAPSAMAREVGTTCPSGFPRTGTTV